MTSFTAKAGRAVLVVIVAGLFRICDTAFSQDTGNAIPAAAVPKALPDSRQDCPPDAQVEEAVKLIRAAYEAAYDKAKNTGEPDPLIEQLTHLASQTKDSATKYALLLEAEAVATQYENYVAALDLLANRAAQFRIDGLKLKGQLLKRLAGPRVAADLVLFDQASDTAEQAIHAERFDVAAEAAALAVSVAKAIDRGQKMEAKKRGRSAGKPGKEESGLMPVGPGLVRTATALQATVSASQKLFLDYEEALTQIKSRPEDTNANSAIAKYLCFVRGEWQKGLPALAKSDLEGLKKVAANEIGLSSREKKEPGRVFDLAGAWWSASDSEGLTADQQSAIKDHAAGLYAEVVENLNDVLKRKLAQSRLRGLTTTQNNPVYLADMPVKRSFVGWDRLRVGRVPDLKINGDVYDKVIQSHAPSLVVFDLPSGFVGHLQGRVAIAGLSKAINPPSSCRFRILRGEDVLWESGIIDQDKNTGLSKIEQFNVILKDMRSVTLEVDSLGSNHSDWSVWVDPVLVRQPTALTGAANLPIPEPAAPGQAQPDPGSLIGFKDSIGKTFAFNVTGVANRGSVWGSNPYTADSLLARAAVHAGVLRPGESGVVNATVLPGLQSYEGTVRNGVTTNRWGAYGLSYRIASGTAGNQAGHPGHWLEGLEPESLQKRYWKIVNVGLPQNLALNVYNEDDGRGRCVAFVGVWAAYTGQLWDLREPGVFSNKFLRADRILSVDAAGEVFMGTRQAPLVTFTTLRNADGKSYKIRTRGGFLSADEAVEGRDARLLLSATDLGDRSSWFFLPTAQLIVQPNAIQP